MRDIDGEKLEQLAARARREIDSGLLPSCQYAVALDGEIIAGETLGDATDDNRYVVFSATKAVVASTFWTLIQDGLVDISLPVVHYVPEFMADGEPERGPTITVEQVLLHTSGFPHAPLGPPAWWTREGRLDKMRSWRCNWEPGTAFEYHASTAHWVLAEIIERLTGTDFRAVVRERVLDPHGLDRLQVGVPEDEQGDVTELVAVGDLPTPDEIEAAFGVRELPLTEVTEAALLGFNEPAVRALGVPGGGGISDASSFARFYQALLHNPKGVWDDDLLADVTTNVRNTFPDPMTGVPIRRTLGLCTAGDDGKASYRGFGKTGSPRRFGHNGAGGQIVWADPDSGLSFVYLTNGIDANPIRQAKRGVALSSIAAEIVTP
ncbi:serine hydrolase domain-containing protein [Actinospongicola halichondriae]|uniref:serine hydrolase domain-containing protein n=1 Tax=Actinospongicola halichondriae TaxID=3236844 RepID=UPI003D3D6BC9